MLGVIEVEEHQQHQHANHDDVEQILLVSNLRQPANLRALVDDADFARPLRRLPEDAEVRDQLRRDIVHHQREQRLIRIPLCLEQRRDAAPNRAGKHTGQQHHEYQRPVRQHVAQENHATGGGKAAHQRLTFAADVPKAHLKGRSQCNGNAQQAGKITQRPRETGGVHKRAVPHNAVHADGVQAGNKKDEERIHNKCQQDSNGAHQHFLHKGGTLPLGDTHKRFSCSFAHHLPSFCTRLVMRRPTSSLVVVRASSMPLALPPHSTRMRSHSSSRTSRSSPT